ncbi:hypothetical protein ACKVB7_003701 [Klebsiella pneumoniae]|uniref:hypothetical protein n=1 Tax=Klebsiella pneumoniae TaxID=573 RepID=UPI001E2C45A8|nr:hypothetical protein [Klebsiella pneumoniae]HBQ5873566.1 hypothetical protein [Klebsiella pneumoniae subsp. pneumoniae]EJM9047710.1 hypothetical protein [Klebsiella pneumoniae]EKV0315404.1 hypothetical protein [Klebsiella pneumoniae]EKV3478477.1 hypothetical protein [Klebsiella pneumoniae]EKV5106005.1 hypothetical protein [Klebsiella pneumoniae]
MKNLLKIKTVRDSIAAAMNGRTIEQMETEQRQDAVKSAVDEYLIRHPDWQPSTKPAPKAAPVRDTKQKTVRIKKSLGAGAGGFQAHEIDPEMLCLAREKCRQVVASDPERYSHIIESTPLKRIE